MYIMLKIHKDWRKDQSPERKSLTLILTPVLVMLTLGKLYFPKNLE